MARLAQRLVRRLVEPAHIALVAPDESRMRFWTYAPAQLLALPHVSFTRDTTATFVNSSALIETAAANTPRIQHDNTGAPLGYLPEKAATNLILRSEDVGNAAWTKEGVTISANAAIAPDGTMTADKVIEDSSTGRHTVYQAFAVTPAAVYTKGTFLKRAEVRYVQVSSQTDSNYGVIVDLDTGEITDVNDNSSGTGSARVEAFADGWYRVSPTMTTDDTGWHLTVCSSDGPTPNYDSSDNPTYTGDGVSGFYMWGGQGEPGPVATSYIPTTTTTVTRNADILYRDVPSLEHGGFVRAELETLAAYGADDVILDLQDKDATDTHEQVIIQRDGETDDVTITTRDGNSTQADLGSNDNAMFDGSLAKLAVSWGTNDVRGVVDGAVRLTDTGATNPAIDRIYFGCSRAGGSHLGTPIRSVSYGRRQPSNSEMQSKTA